MRAARRSAAGPGGAPGPIRALLLGLVLLGILATAAELLLLGHTEQPVQWMPIALLALGLAALGTVALRPGVATLRAFHAVMTAFVAAGVLGILLHYRGNVEFELEMYPGLEGFELFRKAVTGATPALAPGMMAHVGLLGLVSTYHHPKRLRPAGPAQPENEGSME